jgi:regulator of sigma E protease
MSIVILALLAPSLDNAGKLLIFVLALSVLIVLHEAGHFLVARRNGVRVNDFAIGFGPTLFKWTSPRSGTNYRINILPLGGYCAMQGEDGKTNEAEQQRQFRTANPAQSDNFQAKTPLQRLAIVVAGPIANFVLAYVILFVGAVTFGVATPNGWTTQVGNVQPGKPAEKAGLRFGDRIVGIDGVPYSDGAAMVKKIRGSAGVPLKITYERHGVRSDVEVTPLATVEDGKTIGQLGFFRVPSFVRTGPLEGLQRAGEDFWDGFAGNFTGLAGLIMHPAEHASSMSGVIGMERAASEVQDLGWSPYLRFVAMISIALGVFNLLPIPALDGGRAVFIIAEMLRGRPVDPEREALVHFTGFAVLMALMVFVAYHDIANIVSGKGVF